VPRSITRILLLLLLTTPVASRVRAQDAGSAGDLGQLLSLEDRRQFDGAILLRAAQHPDAVVRARAAMAMGRIGDRAATVLLLPMLQDQDSMVRTETAFALGELGDPAAVPELAALAGRFPPNAQGELVIEIVTALAKLGGPEAERALEGILDRHSASSADRSDRATATVLGEAWRLGRRSSLNRLLGEYVRTARGDWRRNAVYSAGRLRVAAAASAMLDAAADSDATIRAYAARSLVAPLADSAAIARDVFVATLRPLVNDADAQVRTNALRALASFPDSALVPLVAARLVDRDPNVAVQAANTLDTLKGSRAAAILAERFPGGGSFAFRRAVLLALAHASPTQAIETGRAWRADPDWRNRAAYIEMLGVAATPAARQQLAEMAEDPDPRVVGFVLNALEAVVPAGDSALLALARAKLGAADLAVRSAAIGLLDREKNPAWLRDFAAAYRRAEADPENDARLAAVNALADIAELSSAARAEVEASFLAAFPRSPDYITRRLLGQRFGDATLRRYWGAVFPVETGRSVEEYRDLARRYILGQARPGSVTIETDRGNVVLELYAYQAPLTVENFLRLADRRYFDGGRWHRVVPNFVVQDGDPRGDGSGGPGTVIRDEINRRRYDHGALGMALSGPDTGGSQFFITLSPQPHLDGGYTVFGHVVTGWNVLDLIVQGDRIRRITR
jgi:cyclophilin family peptidyl-prolyl cis-trans isomerase/HEAT repeat protein